jgi:ABC-type nitrate/sulfonate/bicarbonate transport system substrate-binding protein
MNERAKPTMKFRPIVAFAPALIVIVAFAALPVGAAVSTELVNVGYGSIAGSQAPLWTAKETGLFAKQGLHTDLIYIPSGSKSVMSLLGGSIQFLNFSAMPSLEAYLSGSDNVLIASTMNRLDHSLIVQPSIKTVADLRGKTLGIGSLGAMVHVVLLEGLRFKGLTDSEVTILGVGDSAARISSLRTGRVNGVMLSGSPTLAALKMGFKELIDFSKMPIAVSVSSILSRRSYILKNPETTLKFLKAWTEAIYLFRTDRQLGINVLRKYTRIDNPGVLDLSYSIYRELIEPKPIPSAAAVRSMYDILSRIRGRSFDNNPDGFIEARFTKELETSGFFDEMSRKYPFGQ